MKNDKKNCPNCNASCGGIFTSNVLLLKSEIDAINRYKDLKAEGYCSKCGQEILEEVKFDLRDKVKNLKNKVSERIALIPIVTTHHPHQWDYEIVDIVTAQSATGTGVITEFTSTFTDLIGAQSDRHNKKIKEGENLCFAQLKKAAFDLNANAVIAADIDYSEIGGGKGILMVCMSGTAVKVKNPDALGLIKFHLIAELPTLINEYNELLSQINSLKDSLYFGNIDN